MRGRRRLAIASTLCPTARNFSGSLLHTLTCSGCGHVACVREPFTHLSLQLLDPAGPGVVASGRATMQQLLARYLQARGALGHMKYMFVSCPVCAGGRDALD